MIATVDFPKTLRHEARQEAKQLLRWWALKAPDDRFGGFWGEIDAHGQPVREAPKSAILNTRMLWFFSAMAAYLDSDESLLLAHRAANYIRSHFLDPDHGGVYWLVDHKGQVIDAKKQGYAQAFAVYAFAEYHKVTQDRACLDIARQIQGEIEERFWDRGNGGYIEAMSAFWYNVGDQRLSDKDTDCPKTMNTHLHILEAYTNLHRAAPDEVSHAALYRALDIFIDRFVDHKTHNLKLFYDMDWADHTAAISYGHDIEASWLMWEAAEVLNEPDLLRRVKPLTLELAREVLRDGLNGDGGVAYERRHDGHLDGDGEWWGQAEGLVGFVNAWQLSGDGRFLDATARLWDHMKDQYGAGGRDEWTWYAGNAGRPAMYKAGMWKCPYHSGRAMIEIDHRLKRACL
ncbi:MAG: AGE family epimerase/isomerase [Asticcacaulis sp.]|nr:AGE family epimerase/isomerase [Asticcacaulis sp.]